MRVRMVLMAVEGVTNDQIASRLDTRGEVGSLWRNASLEERLAGLEVRPRPGRLRVFPPELVVQVKALACELPATHGVAISRWNTPDIARKVCDSGLAASISGSTITMRRDFPIAIGVAYRRHTCQHRM